MKHVDASLDWMQVSGGKVLWRPGDISDSFYIVINGRLRAIDDSEEGKVKILGEYGQGDSVSTAMARIQQISVLKSRKGRRARCYNPQLKAKYCSCYSRLRISSHATDFI